MTEIERWRADLKTLQRCQEDLTRITGQGSTYTANAIREIECRIAQLEAKANPWRRAKSAVEYFRGFAPHNRAEHDVVAYVDHLEAENVRLKAENRHTAFPEARND